MHFDFQAFSRCRRIETSKYHSIMSRDKILRWKIYSRCRCLEDLSELDLSTSTANMKTVSSIQSLKLPYARKESVLSNPWTRIAVQRTHILFQIHSGCMTCKIGESSTPKTSLRKIKIALLLAHLVWTTEFVSLQNFAHHHRHLWQVLSLKAQEYFPEMFFNVHRPCDKRARTFLSIQGYFCGYFYGLIKLFTTSLYQEKPLVTLQWCDRTV